MIISWRDMRPHKFARFGVFKVEHDAEKLTAMRCDAESPAVELLA